MHHASKWQLVGALAYGQQRCQRNAGRFVTFVMSTFYSSTPHSFLLISASPSGCSISSVCFCTHKLTILSVRM